MLNEQPMDVIKQIESDLSQAAKNKDGLALLVLRGLKTALVNLEIAKTRQALTDQEIFKAFRTEVKRRQEATTLYQKGGRPELAEKEIKEIEIIKRYLPAEISPEVIKSKVQAEIISMAATGPQDLGKVMAKVMAFFQGQADGGLVNKIVAEELNALKK